MAAPAFDWAKRIKRFRRMLQKERDLYRDPVVGKVGRIFAPGYTAGKAAAYDDVIDFVDRYLLRDDLFDSSDGGD